MDYEDFLTELYTPVKAIETLTDIIYEKANNDWEFLSNNTKRKHFEELIAINYLIHLTSKELLSFRENLVGKLGKTQQ